MKVIILDNNELSIAMYAQEYPENWKKICKSLDTPKGGRTRADNRPVPTK